MQYLTRSAREQIYAYRQSPILVNPFHIKTQFPLYFLPVCAWPFFALLMDTSPRGCVTVEAPPSAEPACTSSSFFWRRRRQRRRRRFLEAAVINLTLFAARGGGREMVIHTHSSSTHTRLLRLRVTTYCKIRLPPLESGRIETSKKRQKITDI